MSIKYQIKKIVFGTVVDQMTEQHIQNNNIPKTRDEAKKYGKAERYIYSYRTAEKVMAVMNRVAKHSGITDIRHLRKKHTAEYLKHHIKKGSTKNTLLTERYGIRKFEKCMISTGWLSKYDDSICPTNVKIPKGSRINPIGRYNLKETKIIYKYMQDYNKEIAAGLKIQESVGLRISELKELKVKHINIKERKVIIKDNMAKGGRYRCISIDQSDLKFFKNLIKNKDEEEKIISISKRWIQKITNKTCEEKNIKKRGTHGMRGLFAYKRLKKYCQIKNIKGDIKHFIDDPISTLTKEEVKVLKLVSNDLGHNRISIIRKHYLKR